MSRSGLAMGLMVTAIVVPADAGPLDSAALGETPGISFLPLQPRHEVYIAPLGRVGTVLAIDSQTVFVRIQNTHGKAEIQSFKRSDLFAKLGSSELLGAEAEVGRLRGHVSKVFEHGITQYQALDANRPYYVRTTELRNVRRPSLDRPVFNGQCQSSLLPRNLDR